MSLFAELKRRSVFRVAIGYIGVSWLVIQVIETLFGIYDVDESVAQIIVNVLAIGFLPALILAWVFEWTPEGIRRDVDADRTAPAKQKLDRRLDRIVMAVLVVAVVFFAVDKFILDPDRDEQMVQQALIGSYGTKSVAVMPFLNMSSDPEQEYFSDGITEELLNLLAQVQDLRVISRTSVFALKGLDLSVPEIGGRLNVDHVLEGSVRKSGNEIRITAQLIDANTDTHLWSQTYDRDLVDIFDIQDEIAALVVNELKAELLGDMPKVIRTDPTVLTLVLQSRRVRDGPSQSRGTRARALLEEALRIDPNYAPAIWDLILVNYYEVMSTQPFDPLAFEQMAQINNELEERARALAPNNAFALFSIGWNAFEMNLDFQKAADYIERAIAAAPGDEEILRSAAAFARRIGHFDTAIRLKQLAAERNPECPVCINIWNDYRDARRYDDAIAAWLAYGGQTIFSSDVLVNAALLSGDFELALEYAPRCNWPHACSAMALHSLGRREEALAELELQRKLPPERQDIVGTAMATMWLGDEEGAVDLLYERYWPHTYHFYQQVLHPIWEPLHDNPRWIALREKSGRTAEAYAAIRFEPVLPEVSR
jgi:TolB-like protein/tetratricopeptide (TPR) repeat protein